MKICSIIGCEKKHYGRGYCAPHFQKFKKYGDPNGGCFCRTVAKVGSLQICSTCRVPQDLREFYFRKDTGKLTGQCKTCKAAKVDKENRINVAQLRRNSLTPEEKEKRNAYGRGKYEESKMNPEKFTARVDRLYFNKIKSMFGISRERYVELFESQDGVCAICGSGPKKGHHLCVDHDHTSGKIRALLCHQCNLAVGNVKESLDIAKKLAQYIEEHSQLSASESISC